MEVARKNGNSVGKLKDSDARRPFACELVFLPHGYTLILGKAICRLHSQGNHAMVKSARGISAESA